MSSHAHYREIHSHSARERSYSREGARQHTLLLQKTLQLLSADFLIVVQNTLHTVLLHSETQHYSTWECEIFSFVHIFS